MMAAERFKRSVERALLSRPFKTPLGLIRTSVEDVHMGSPSGRHDVPPAWVYAREGVDLEMAFQFYGNFTAHDLICKVVQAGDYPKTGQGASVQFNSDLSMRSRADHVVLVHHGRVTIGKSVSRNRLVDAMLGVCPSEVQIAGIPISRNDWPHEIGSTKDVYALLDSIFLYAYCVEQAKRYLRDESPLAALV